CGLVEKDKAIWIVVKPNVTTVGDVTYALRKTGQPVNKAAKQVRFDAEGNCIIENDMYKITLDKSKGGVITSLLAKHIDNRQFVDPYGPYGLGEIAGHFYEEGKFHSSKDNPATITVLEDNPFIVKIRIAGYIDSH